MLEDSENTARVKLNAQYMQTVTGVCLNASVSLLFGASGVYADLFLFLVLRELTVCKVT